MPAFRKRVRVSPAFWLAALIVPIAAPLGTTALLARIGGEFYNIREVLEMQAPGNRECLFGPAYSSPEVHYKMERILRDPPDLLAIGSSRVLQFRREFFKDDIRFYNGGRIAGHAWFVRRALGRLPESARPGHLIVGLDQYDFNPAYSEYQEEDIIPSLVASEFEPQDEGWNRFGDIWPEIAADFAGGKIDPFAMKSGDTAIGMMARLKGSGFRNDGSYRYGEILSLSPADRSGADRVAPALDLIERGKSIFEPGPSADPAVVEEVERLLSWCRAHDVGVTAFLPPYAPAAARAMKAPGAGHGYLGEIPGLLQPVFRRHGFALFDFTEVPGFSDDAFIDGFHAGEAVHVKMLLGMAAGDPGLAVYLDTDRLNALLAAEDPLDVGR